MVNRKTIVFLKRNVNFYWLVLQSGPRDFPHIVHEWDLLFE